MTPRASSFLTRSCTEGAAIPRSEPRSAYERRPCRWRISSTRASLSLSGTFFGNSLDPLGDTVAVPTYLRYTVAHMTRSAGQLSMRRNHSHGGAHPAAAPRAVLDRVHRDERRGCGRLERSAGHEPDPLGLRPPVTPGAPHSLHNRRPDPVRPGRSCARRPSAT